MATNPKVYSAIDLLDKILDFTSMTPNSKEWNLRSLKSNPPRHIRLRQIDALLHAFCPSQVNQNIISKTRSIFDDHQKKSIEAFLRGDFIKTRSVTEYTGLFQFIKDFAKNKNGIIDQERQVRLEELVFIFPKLIDFKSQIRSLLTFNSGWLEASSPTSLFSIYITNSISHNLVGKYDELDDVIEQFINPQGFTFTEKELIDKYNFPTENLNDVDMDFI